MQIIFEDVEEESGQGPSFIDSAVGIFSLLNRFIKAIQKKKKKNPQPEQVINRRSSL